MRAQRDIGRRIVDDDLHRHALHDLHVVAGRILRGKKRERRDVMLIVARQ
jgi:hypothetical protein